MAENKVCVKCSGDPTSRLIAKKEIITCDICEKYSFHPDCVNLNIKSASLKSETALLHCPPNYGCCINDIEIQKHNANEWKCKLCTEKTVELQCHSCRYMYCHKCANISEKAVTLFRMLLQNSAGFKWECNACVAYNTQDKIDESKGNDEISNESICEENKNSDCTTDKILPENRENSTENFKYSKICKHYLKNKCKYGISGNGCKFAHPKRCHRFIEQGWYGCKSSKFCGKFHPRMCENSFRYMRCTDEYCRELHIKGTRIRSTNFIHTDQMQTSRQTPCVQTNHRNSQTGQNMVNEYNNSHFGSRRYDEQVFDTLPEVNHENGFTSRTNFVPKRQVSRQDYRHPANETQTADTFFAKTQKIKNAFREMVMWMDEIDFPPIMNARYVRN